MKDKIALVHDWLVGIAGGEKLLEAIYEIYPAPIYTLVLNRENLKNTKLYNAEIITSFIQKLPFSKTKYRNYLLFFPLAIEQLDLSSYDIIISSNSCVAKGVITKTTQLHICYCHTPIRYAWDLYHQYLKEAKLDKGLKGFIAKLILHYIRIWDYTTSNRVDYFIANSKNVAKRIKKIYNKDAKVIYPPVEVDKFEANKKREDYYITISRLVPYKKIDLIVEAFSHMKEKKLLVIGDGPDYKKIKQKALNKNIELLGYQPFEKLKYYLERAKGFIFAGEEDFGIVIAEALASGTPVIAYGKGGALEIVDNNKTGIFFYKQKIEDIIQTIEKFEKIYDKFDFNAIKDSMKKFSKERFQKEIKNFIEEKKEKKCII